MQATSETWKTLWASGSARLEARARIGGREYRTISAPVISRGLMQGELGVGNAVAACCRLSVLTGDAIPRSAEVAVSMRLTDGTTESEWLPAGTFYISRRNRDAVTGLVTLECYDALLKANGEWTPSEGSWPRLMADVAEELAETLGVTLDPGNALRTENYYCLDAPEKGTTIRDALSAIAAAHGGNWIVSPGNLLRLVPLASASEAGTAENAATVAGVVGGITVSGAGTITGIRYTVDNEAMLVGDDTGIVLEAAVSNPVALDLAEWVIGLTHQAYELKGAILDPAAEPGDFVIRGEDVAGLLANQTATLGLAYRADVSAPEAGDLADEYPYPSSASRTLRSARAYARQAVEALDAALDQGAVLDRLTGGGVAQGLFLLNGQLYVNATYIRSGTLTLGGRNNGNGMLQVLNAANRVIGAWDKDGIQLNEGSLSFPLTGSWGDGDYIALNRDDACPLDSQYTFQNGSVYRVSVARNCLRVKNLTTLNEANVNADGVTVRTKDGTRASVQLYDDSGNRYVLLWDDGLKLYSGGALKASVDVDDGIYTAGDLNVGGDVILQTPLGVSGGGTGLSASPSLLVNLAGSAAADVLQAAPRPGVTGTLSIANGGTGATTAAGMRTNAEAAYNPYLVRASTWSDIKAAFEKIPLYRHALLTSFYEVSQKLTGNEINGTLNMMITRDGSNSYFILALTSSGLKSWHITNITDSGATIGAITTYATRS